MRKNESNWLWVCGMSAALLAVAVTGVFAAGHTDIRVGKRNWVLDFPAGRCGGHAPAGVRWTAPKAATVTIAGAVWKIRDLSPADVSLWVKGKRVFDRVPLWASYRSARPYTFAQIITDQSGNPKVLENISVRPGDEICVELGGNDYTGLDLRIGKKPDGVWDLANDFSHDSNPAGPWAFGQVVVDDSGKPGLKLFESLHLDFDPDQKGLLGRKQPAWFSKNLLPHVSMMKSRGKMPFIRDVRFTSGKTICLEAMQGDRWAGCYRNAGGRINFPGQRWGEDAFQLAIEEQALSGGWQWVSASEVSKTDRGARHFVVQLENVIRPVRLKIHTLLDGTPVMTRWLEVTNTSDKPAALTAVAPWSGRLWADDPVALGYFTRSDWAHEGWFDWKPLPEGATLIQCRAGQGHDDPFFIVRNEARGEYFIGHLAWSANWDMEFETTKGKGLVFRIGPAASAAQRVIAPGETITTPAVHLGHVEGDLDATVQAMHDHLRRFVLPTRKPERSYLIQCLVPGDQGYFTGRSGANALNEVNIRKSIDVAAALGVELFTLDYGWWDTPGDWVPSAGRFPNGLEPVRQYARDKGLLFGLYLETEGGRGNMAQSRMAKQHPDWLTGPRGIMDLTKPEAAAWVESEISRIVQQYKPDLFRLDYNPSNTGEGTVTERNGFTENNYWRYYEACYGIYERTHKKYPDLILQQCAAGGARNDLGIAGRFHETYLTDGLWMPLVLQDYSGQTLALPPENLVIAIGAPGWKGPLDTYLRATFTLSTPLIAFGSAPSAEDLNPENRQRFLHYVKIYKQFIRPLLPACRTYHHAPVSSRGGVTSSGWFAMEYAAEDRSKAWATFVRIGPSKFDSYRFRPRGLDPGKTYLVTFDRLGTTAKVGGLELMRDGLPVRLESIMSSELLLFEGNSGLTQ